MFYSFCSDYTEQSTNADSSAALHATLFIIIIITSSDDPTPHFQRTVPSHLQMQAKLSDSDPLNYK